MEKLHNVLMEIMMETRCLSDMFVQFLQPVEQACFAAFAQFFGVSLGFTTRSNSSVDLQEARLMCLCETHNEMACW